MVDQQIGVIISVDADGAITAVNDFVGTLGNISPAADSAGNSISNMSSSAASSLSATASSADSTGTSMLDMTSKIGRVASHGLVAWDRLSIAQNAVDNAQIRQTLSAERLAAAITRYGAGSKEATKAQQELDIATRGVEIATQREMVRMTIGIAVVIPGMITGVRDLIKMAKELDLANISNIFTTDGLTASRLALLAATGVGLVAAVAIGGAIAGGAFNVKTPVAGGVGGGDINLYGDVNVGGVQNPADFGREVSNQAQSQINRGMRP